jgi:uncharacterized protein (DUF2336 family)
MSASDTVRPMPTGAHADRLLADAARAADGARARLTGALNDLFRTPEYRLSDRDHATMTRMLAVLVETIEHDLRSHLIGIPPVSLSEDLKEEFTDRDFPVAGPRLARSRVMRDADLAAQLLRHCDEHHIGRALRAAYPRGEAAAGGLMERLTSHDDGAIADAAASMLVAESRRWDRFGDPVLNRADLPIELQHRMTWWIAAALRDHMLHEHEMDPAAADRALVTAVTALMTGYDERETVDARAHELAIRLARVDALDDTMLVALLYEGQLSAWVAALAVRALLDTAAVWTMLADADVSRLTLLLRSIGMERHIALGLLAGLFAARTGSGAVHDLQLSRAATAFDDLSIDQARAAIRAWGLDDHYRRAIAGLDAEGDGRG